MALWSTYSMTNQDGESVVLEINVRDNDPSRLTNITWENPRFAVQTFKVTIWDDVGAVVFESTFSSPNGQQNIPGNQQLTEYTDAAGTYYDLPPGWSLRFESL